MRGDAALSDLSRAFTALIRISGGHRSRRVEALDRVGNRYEISRCQRSAAVFYIGARGATIGTEALRARCADRPMHSLCRELELVAGRFCDSPGCAESANP